MENETLFPLGIDIVIVARAPVTKIKSDVLSGYFKNKAVREIEEAVCEK